MVVKGGRRKKEWMSRPVQEILWDINEEILEIKKELTRLDKKPITGRQPKDKMTPPWRAVLRGLGPDGEDLIIEAPSVPVKSLR
jgi:hypothetical protein